MKFVIFSFTIFTLSVVLSVFLVQISDFITARKLHHNFIFFKGEKEPTEFFYNGKKVSVYIENRYLKSKINEWHRVLHIETLYINNIPALEIECFERLWHTQRDVYFNNSYSRKEIEEILKQGVKEWHKKINENTSQTKSILD